MKIKNISATPLPLDFLPEEVQPGEIVDLSEFDPKFIYTHKKLNIYFDKGLFVNLGNTTPVNSKVALNSAEDRIAKLGLANYVAKTSKPKKTNRQKINELMKKEKESKQSIQPNFDHNKERYNEQYYKNTYPDNYSDYQQQGKPQIQTDNKFKPMKIDPVGVITEFGAFGNIETEVLTGKISKPAIRPAKKQKPKQDAYIVKDIHGNEYEVSLTAIEQRMKRQCIATNSHGKPCQKYAVTGFRSCMTHMSKQEREEYEKLKRDGIALSIASGRNNKKNP